MKAYFAPNLKVKNEEEILLGDAKVIRPDRLVFEGEKITIIDYKTGRALPEHKRQIEKYKNALEAMGYKDVACVLAYVNDEGVSVKQF